MSIVATGQEFELSGEGAMDFLSENQDMFEMTSDGKIRSKVPLLKDGGHYYYKISGGSWQVVNGLSYNIQRSVSANTRSSRPVSEQNGYYNCKIIRHKPNDRILNKKQLKSFIKALKVDKLISYQGDVIDYENFEEKFDEDFKGVTITLKNKDGSEEENYSVDDYEDREDIVKKSGEIIRAHGAGRLEFYKPGRFKITPKGSKILRYVAYMEMLDSVKEIIDFKYRDAGMEKGDELAKKVDSLIALMDIKEATFFHKYPMRDRFVRALKMWKDAYNKAKNMDVKNGYYIEETNEPIYTNKKAATEPEVKYSEPFYRIDYNPRYEDRPPVNLGATHNTNNIIRVDYKSTY